MTTTERSETPDIARLVRKLRERAHNLHASRAMELGILLDEAAEALTGLEAELTALRSERDAQWTVLKLLFERFPDCACIGDLPGCVDELRLRYTWKPMKDAPRDRLVWIRHLRETLWPFMGYAHEHPGAGGWMEIP